MRRRIVIGLAAYAAVFLVCGAYIANSIRTATDGLDRLVTLHQVELLRGDYLRLLRAVQSDLVLVGTSHRSSGDRALANIARLGRLADGCFECHHSPDAVERLTSLRRQTAAYREALARVPDVHASAGGPVAEEEVAFQMGEELIAQVRDLVEVTTARLGGRTERAMREITHARHLLYALVAIGPVLSALLGFAFISGLVRPVGVLLESTRRLKSGDLDHHVEELPDEFRELGISFNEMSRSLKQQMQRMQRTEQLAVAGQLAAGLAHEIKNPLAGINAAMQVLAAEGSLCEEDRRLVEQVKQEVGRVDGLMKSFLHFARPARPQLVPLRLDALVERTLALRASAQPAPRNGEAPVRIVTELGTVPETMADPMQLQQVLLNLVLNAIEATPGGGTVIVRTSFDGAAGTLCVEVADTGRGVDPADAPRLFEPFFTTKAEGTGLGLAISKRLVEQHGGTIAVATNPGGGALFRVQLPLVPTTPEAPP